MREDGQRTCFVLGKTPGSQRILLWDPMEGVFKWTIIGARHRPAVYKTGTFAYNGNHSLRLWSGAVTPDGDVESTCYRSFPIGTCPKIRFECVWHRGTTGAIAGFGFYWYNWVDGVETRAGIRWALHSPYIWYINEAGGWTYVVETAQILAEGAWHRWAWEVDLHTQRYGVVELDGKRHDFSAYGFYVGAQGLPTAGQGVRLVVWVSGSGGNTHFDDVLVRAL